MNNRMPPDSQILDLIESDLFEIIEENECASAEGYLRLCIKYLGYDEEKGLISDGKNDGGIDYLEHSTSGASIIQAKSIEFELKMDLDALAGPSHITDIPRIISILEHLDGDNSNLKLSLKHEIAEMKQEIRTTSEIPTRFKAEPYRITIDFCFQGKGFTPAGQSEFDKLQHKIINYAGREIEVKVKPIFLQDLIAKKWSETNTKWKNKQNKKVEEFDFSVQGSALRHSKWCVFFTDAKDLVAAYKEIGYQIFEPMLDVR